MTRVTGPADAVLRDRAERALTVPVVAALGCELIDPDVPAAGARVVFRSRSGNGACGVHTAPLSALLELAAYLAVAPTLGPDEHAVTTASSLQVMRAVPLDVEVAATGVLDRRTRRIAFVTVAALVGDDLVARLQVTKAITVPH